MWFIGLESPPADGKYGVAAHIEGAGVKFGGDYYFELDYHTGQFLWGREIRHLEKGSFYLSILGIFK